MRTSRSRRAGAISCSTSGTISRAIARSVLWERVMGAVKKVTPQAVIAELKPSRGVWATIPELNDAVLFLEIEGKTLGVYLSTYGLPADKVRELQPWIDDLSLVAT